MTMLRMVAAEEHGEGDGRKEAAAEGEAVLAEVDHDEPDGEAGEDGGGERLSERAEEGAVELGEAAAGDHLAEGGGFGVDPGDGHGRQGGADVEAHAELAGLDDAARGEDDGGKELEGEVSAEPGDGDAPLKGPDLRAPVDVICVLPAAKEREEEGALAENEDGADEGLANDDEGGSEEAVVKGEGGPAEEAAEDSLPQANTGDVGDKAAALEEGEGGIDLEGAGGGEDDKDPGEGPGDGVGGVGVAAKEEEAGGEEDDGHEQSGGGVPANCLLEDGGEPVVGEGGTGNRAVRVDVEVCGLVAGGLEDDGGEAELKDDLEGDERVEGVVVALLDGGEGASDKGEGEDAGERGPATGEDGEGDGAVEAEFFTEKASEWTGGEQDGGRVDEIWTGDGGCGIEYWDCDCERLEFRRW